MSGNEVRKKYLDFMAARGHAVIPSAALVPENDPTTLFTGSGMQPLIPYLMGETHPKGTRLADSQKCFRAEDIEEVGDNRHTTFFEMLGNWSLGDYFKEEQLQWFFAFLTEEIGLDPERLFVTVYIGDAANQVPKDTVSAEIWNALFREKGIDAATRDIGSEADGYRKGMGSARIFFYSDKNWWSRAGSPEKMPIGEIGGPDSEVFYDFKTPHDPAFGEHCHPNCDCGRFLEIGNSVFIEYLKAPDSSFQKLPKQNVDFGGGLERITAAKNGVNDVFKIDLLAKIITQLEELSGSVYDDNRAAFRIITDHIRGAVFMIGDGVLPGNAEQGYFVRRLIRRSVRYADVLGIPPGQLKHLAASVIATYSDHYRLLADTHDRITQAIADEEAKFRETLERGLKEFNRMTLKMTYTVKNEGGTLITTPSAKPSEKLLDGKAAFDLFTSYGFPIELTQEIAREKGMDVDMPAFEALMEEHRSRSRAGAAQKFKGGLADHSEKVVQYHTATHLMLAGLRKELGTEIHQAGSNITGERLRFDFTYPERVERDVLDRVEQYVNDAIKAKASVTLTVMQKEAAHKDPSVEGSFWERYPDQVNVYSIVGSDGTVYSRELCGGPHVENTGDINGVFKITKEESSSAGVRRIKAVLV